MSHEEKDKESERKSGSPTPTSETEIEEHAQAIIDLIGTNDKKHRNERVKRKILELIQILEESDLAKNNEKDPIRILAFPISIEAVLQHLNQDMRDDWFIDAMEYRDLFNNKNDLRQRLQTIILEGNGRYLGSERTLYNVPKKGIGIRYALETDFYDRFIYQAICTFLIPFYDPLLSPRVLGHRYNKHRLSERYLFKSRIDLWNTFEGVTKTSLNNNQSLLVTDIINYFENISIETIRISFETKLEQINASGHDKLLIRNAIGLLCTLLAKWGYSDRYGLPQNRDASSFIANVVLDSVDHRMVELGYDYYRYVDDIRIICETPRAAKRALTELINELRSVGMNINSGKTKILSKESTAEEISDSFPNADDRSLTIDSMWRSKSRRVIARSAKYIYQLLRECIDQKQTQSRQFRFATNRLIQLVEARLFDVHADLSNELKAILIETLEDHTASTDQYCRILWSLKPTNEELLRISSYLQDETRSIFSWQNHHLWLLLARTRYKDKDTIALAMKKMKSDILQSECSAIFIYLRCVDEADKLESVIQQFSSDWPYSHRRSFILATSEFSQDKLSCIVPMLDTKTRLTASRARPHFDNGTPLIEREPMSVLSLYEEISPYD